MACRRVILRSFTPRRASSQLFCSRAEVDDGHSSKKSNKKKSSSLKKSDSKGAAQAKETDSDASLIKSLKKQLMEATDLANKFQTVVRGSFKPFEVVPGNGGSDLTLRRSIGKEEVLLKCLLDMENPHVEDHDRSDDSEESDVDELHITQRLTLHVQVFKGSSQDDEQPRMAFLCSYTKGEAVTIEDIAYLGKSIKEDYPYSGPCFRDLDDNLRQVFQNVIKTRGINSGLADTIIEHLTNQYQNEYLEWLKKVRDFLMR